MMRWLIPFASGALFALGLALSGMTQPTKVIGFLDFTGAWDPSLAFVMLGAIGVHFFAYRIVERGQKPLAAARFEVPTAAHVDRRLIAGSALFGIGWGLAGYCPGPALVSLASGMLAPLVMVGSMLVGMLLHERLVATESERAKAPTCSAEDLV